MYLYGPENAYNYCIAIFEGCLSYLDQLLLFMRRLAHGNLDIFRRSPPIRDAEALADFIDRNAAFVVQKGIYEYSRARAGHYAKVLFREPEFQAAAEQSRWRAYRSGLVLVAELVEGVLRPAAGTIAKRKRMH